MRSIEHDPTTPHAQQVETPGNPEDAVTADGGFSENIQAAPNIRLAKPTDAKNLAEIYQEGYAAPPWNEDHDFKKMLHHFERWIEDPDYQVLVLADKEAANGENLKGFTVTRIEPSQAERMQRATGELDPELPNPIDSLTQSIAEEMEAVSGVKLNSEQITALKESLQNLKPEKLGLEAGRPFASIFQDIVILNSESGDFLNLIRAALGSLLKTESDMQLIYTHEQVNSVVKTAEQLGGEQVLKLDNGLVVYAAPTTRVSKQLAQNQF